MKVVAYDLQPPGLDELASVLQEALQSKFETVSVTVARCPDLRNAPFHLAAEGLTGSERIADVGGQPNLFPIPELSARYSLLSIAERMNLLKADGMLIGAGAGPFFDVGVNNELAPNLSWQNTSADSTPSVTNLTHYTKVTENGSALCEKTPSTNCALMMNLYGSEGRAGPVLKIIARKNLGDKGLTDYIRFGLREHYGSNTPISMGGAFLMKGGVANFHVMPDFPPEDQMPFKSPKQLNDWLTYHDFEAPIVCLTVMHTGDPGKKDGAKLGLRMEHTHCFSTERSDRGGHYHHDIKGEGIEDVEYEAYFNTAKVLFRIDQPSTVLEKDLHDD